MKSLLITLLLCVTAVSSLAQVQLYGQIDTADLKLTECSFEKGAGAMVLFDNAEYFGGKYTSKIIRHKRIKILKENGRSKANIRIEYINRKALEDIDDIEAHTINLNSGVIEVIPVNKKDIYIQKVDNYRKAVVFTFPGVKPGSVLEFKYKWTTSYQFIPPWYFQTDMPVRFSRFCAQFWNSFHIYSRVKQPFTISPKEIKVTQQPTYKTLNAWALSNVPSIKKEPYMAAGEEVAQRIVFFNSYFINWNTVGKLLQDEKSFGEQFNVPLQDEKLILDKAAAVKDSTQKIAIIFNDVKNRMTWDNTDDWESKGGIKKAWLKKTGNSGEINLILMNLLRKAGLDAYPVLIGTPEHSKLEIDYPSLSSFNKTVTYVELDSLNYYWLDAANKRNVYDEVPFDLLGLQSLAVMPDKKKYNVNDLLGDFAPENTSRAIILKVYNRNPSRELVSIKADIKANAKMTGTASITSVSYNRDIALKSKDAGEQVHTDALKNSDNALKINSLKYEDLEADSLPLVQQIEFEQELSISDDKYIYLPSNLFSAYRVNPFVAESRTSNVEFNFTNIYTINGAYTIPKGYTLVSQPQNLSLHMNDGSITFRRTVAFEKGVIAIRIIIENKRNTYNRGEYPILREFYKKMFDILNEPVILKPPGK